MGTWEEAVLWLRTQPDQQELVRAAYFDDPVSAAASRYHLGTEWSTIRGYLPRAGGRALDLGAGRGIASYALAKDGWQVTAVEPDRSPVVGAGAIELLQTQADIAVDIISESGEAIPVAGDSFDLVFCRQALHHARNLSQMCREVWRVLKPGGLFVAVREHVVSRHADLGAFFKLHPLHYRYGGEYAYLLSEYCEAIESSGLTLEKVLNPLASDINLYPRTLAEIRQSAARRLHLPVRAIPNVALAWLGNWIQTPGRLYSFVARK